MKQHTLRTISRVMSWAVLATAAAAFMPAENPRPALRYVDNQAFGFGERLEYRVGYKFITAGTAAFSIAKEPITVNGRPCFDIRFDVQSLKSLDFLYKVRDRYRTLVDIDGVFPWKFEQSIREGGYSRDYSASFDHGAKKAFTTDGEFSTEQYVHDIVSAFYFVRTHDLRKFKKGDEIALKNFYDKETHELKVKVLGRQQVEVDAGIFNCVVIEPMVKQGGLFKSDGRIMIWLSDDDRKIPVKVSTKIPIGSIDAELTSFRGLRGSLASRIGDKQ
ncbi:MAG: DUF3108 domain-containing protein [Candidatus Kapabacteria bacterium]|jgi:hypothetical protein|nr:DUF3108 domain-containing protein [Candidatus Kapabacteria bacterium]